MRRKTRLIWLAIVGSMALSIAPGVAQQAAKVAVDDEGLRIVNPRTGGGVPVPFGSRRAMTLSALAGQGPGEQGQVEECDEGPLAYAEYRGDLTIYFREDRFVGWALGPRGGGRVTTVAGIAPGSTRAQLARAYRVALRRSTIGVEFSAGDLRGTLNGTGPKARITNMWAGTSCIAR